MLTKKSPKQKALNKCLDAIYKLTRLQSKISRIKKSQFSWKCLQEESELGLQYIQILPKKDWIQITRDGIETCKYEVEEYGKKIKKLEEKSCRAQEKLKKKIEIWKSLPETG